MTTPGTDVEDLDVDLKKHRGGRAGKTKDDGGSAWHVLAVLFTVLFNGLAGIRLAYWWHLDPSLMLPVCEGWAATPWLLGITSGILMIFWSYRVTIRASPGRVPPRWEPLLHTPNVDPRFDPLRPNGRLEYCDLCENWKPMRTHHCSRCGHCVPRMDHHCPWTRNCVGFENQKYFLVFILWCCWSLLLTFSIAALDLYTALSVRHETTALAFQDAEVYLSLVVVIYSGALLFGPVGAIGAVQLFGVLGNVTRLELQEFLRMAGEFETWPYGVDWLDNAIQVMGSNALVWLLPLPPKNRTTNGFQYPFAPAYLRTLTETRTGVAHVLDEQQV